MVCNKFGILRKMVDAALRPGITEASDLLSSEPMIFLVVAQEPRVEFAKEAYRIVELLNSERV
jgi:hypothetical protein